MPNSQYIAIENATGTPYLVNIPVYAREPAEVAVRLVALHVLKMQDAFSKDFDTGNVDFELFELRGTRNDEQPVVKLEKA